VSTQKLQLCVLLGLSVRRLVHCKLPIQTVSNVMPPNTTKSPTSSPKKAPPAEEGNRATALYGMAYREWLAEEGLGTTAPPPVDKPAVGLQNLGNMCFLNALIQSLHQTPMLRRNLQRACPEPQDEWLAALLQIFQELDDARNSKMPVHASRLASLIMRASTNGEFARGQQADAHEAFMLIISKLLSGCVVAEDNIPFAEREHLERSSLIGNIFGMDLGQSILCNSCSDESVTTRTEYCVCMSCTLGLSDAQLAALELEASPKSGAASPKNKYSLWKKGKSGSKTRQPPPISDVNAPETSVDELLYAYFEAEEILEWKCEKCSGKKGCTRSVFLPGPPNILLIHVYARQGDGLFGKITRRASFSMDLDLSPYMRNSNTDVAKAGSYTLYAVIVYRHLGPSLGHYIVYIRSRGHWYLLDDQHVRAVEWAEVQNEDPYMLVYESEFVVPPKAIDAEVKAEMEAKAAAEAKAKADAEAKAKARRIKARREAKLKAQAEAKRRAEEEAANRAEEEARQKAEEEAASKAEEEAKRRAEEAARLEAEEAQRIAELAAMAREGESSRARALEEARIKVEQEAAEVDVAAMARPAPVKAAVRQPAQLQLEATGKAGNFALLACWRCRASSRKPHMDEAFGEEPARCVDTDDLEGKLRSHGSGSSTSTSAGSGEVESFIMSL